MIYGMYATAYDPAAAGIFSVTPGTTLALTSARIFETGLKFITPDQRAELTFAAYDIDRRNVYVALTNAVATLAGEITTKGVELAGGFRPIDHLKIWGNVALTQLALWRLRRVDRQHAVECRACHHQRGRVLAFRLVALAGRGRWLGAACRGAVSVRG